MSVDLRCERPEDVQAIDAVTRAAFADAPHSSRTEQAIVRALRASGALSVSVVAADADGEIVGHAAASPVEISDGTDSWFGLGPVSVSPAHQRRGIGSQLVTMVIGQLRDHGAAGCVVLGEPHFYGRFGFASAPSLVLRGVPPEYFLALPLKPLAVSGDVTYHPAFSIALPDP